MRQAVITAPRDLPALRREIAAMRERVRAARPVAPGRFDVKHSEGGMVDAEFAVQFLVLAHSGAHRELRRVQHRARLDEQPTQVPPAHLASERDAIAALWQAVFGG